MAHYIISYDLHNQRNYEPVWDQLGAWGAVRLLESLWVLTSGINAATLRDELRGKMDGDDSVAVIELKPGSEWGSWNAKQAGVDWLSRNIQRY
ncbi:SinR [Mesorhizobium sp. B2-4-6]|uniref:SinR n=1 Tax=Mesorhizobium sp. B2-4-6 TaxID=2589943 RepID=UPI00112AD8ED|nr:SinR [Mesorhizobium sp. B2-4-6]TPL48307.1 SinR [Mesorhizobium sp. B2-4-6]